MNIIKYKKDFLLELTHYQIIMFDTNGILLDSCDTVFPLQHLKSQNIYEIFFFLDGMQDIFNELEAPLLLPLMRPNIKNIEDKIFNFTFKKAAFNPIDSKNHNEDNKNNSLLNIVWIIEDITETSSRQQEIQQESRVAQIDKEFLEIKNFNISLENKLLELQNTELERAKAFKNHFFSQVSHELRTPIQGVVGLSEILLKNTPVPTQVEYLKALMSSAKHLEIILNDILDYSKLEAGKMTLEEVNFNLSETLQNIKLSLLNTLQSKNLNFEVHISPQIPTYVLGDSTRITQVLYNLISNAIKFTQKGSIKVSIELLYYEKATQKNHILIGISDTGIGINEDKIASLFTPYKQAENETFRLFGGTGLGLSIVKELIELQNGTIEVESLMGKGTTFWLTLPLKNATFLSETKKNINHLAGKSVLVADDTPVNILYIKKILLDAGCVVDTVNTGQEIIDIIAERMSQNSGQKNYDILITDLQMPEKTGLEAIEYLRNKAKITKEMLPIVVLSGSMVVDAIESTKNWQEKNINAFLQKPVTNAKLIETLTNILHKDTETIPLKWVNLQNLQNITAGDNVFLAEMLNSCLENAQIELNQMTDFGTAKNWVELKKIGHKIRPTAVMLGNQSFVELILRVETIIKQKTNYDKIPVLLENMHEIFENIAKEIKIIIRDMQGKNHTL